MKAEGGRLREEGRGKKDEEKAMLYSFYRNSANNSMHFIGIQTVFFCILSEFKQVFPAFYRSLRFYLRLMTRDFPVS